MLATCSYLERSSHSGALAISDKMTNSKSVSENLPAWKVLGVAARAVDQGVAKSYPLFLAWKSKR